MKANRITFLAIFCLAFSSISYGLSQPTVPGQSQVRAYTLPLPLDKSTPMERFDIDNIVDEAWNQSMQAKAPSAKKSKKQKKNDKILKQSKKSITFVVDEDLPAPKQTFTMLPSNEISSQIISKKGIPYVDHNVRKTSFDGEKLCYLGEDNFYKCIVQAFADHRSLVLSPDMMWLLIGQGFSRYVNAHSEELRDKLVHHQGKMVLKVEKDNDVLNPDKGDWAQLLNDFSSMIADNTKGDDDSRLLHHRHG